MRMVFAVNIIIDRCGSQIKEKHGAKKEKAEVPSDGISGVKQVSQRHQECEQACDFSFNFYIHEKFFYHTFSPLPVAFCERIVAVKGKKDNGKESPI